MKVKELLATQGKRERVYCGCIGWVSGYKRATEGIVAKHGSITYYKCENCGRHWHSPKLEMKKVFRH